MERVKLHISEITERDQLGRNLVEVYRKLKTFQSTQNEANNSPVMCVYYGATTDSISKSLSYNTDFTGIGIII